MKQGTLTKPAVAGVQHESNPPLDPAALSPSGACVDDDEMERPESDPTSLEIIEVPPQQVCWPLTQFLLLLNFAWKNNH